MFRRGLILACAVMLMLTGTAAAAQENRDRGGNADRLDLYTAEVPPDEVEDLRTEFDVVEVKPGKQGKKAGPVTVDIITSGKEAARLRGRGLKVGLKRNEAGLTTAEAATLEAENGFNVWRSYSEPGGIEEEIRALADQYPSLLKLVKIGESIQGQDILALKLTADANKVKDGKRPAVLYASLQHAREWITVETNRRLLRHYLDNYGSDADITEIVDTTELWFVLVANPDGYDWTFTEGQRLWRKNLRDNNGDGQITPGDGVDLNRNFPTNWGYDNEGSSPSPNSETYRGTAPASEPETVAYNQLLEDVDPVFLVNYHSAAELLLYGIGWQVATPSPDDLLHIAVNGTDENPAVAGYDPDISAELYTTNGDTTDHAAEAFGVMAYTPELDTCDSAEAIFPDDDFGEDYCESEGRSVFEFPDDEALIQAVFEKNLPYALSIAKSADDPAHPDTELTTGLEAPAFSVDSFSVSYGDPQTVAVEARRSIRGLRMTYAVNGRRAGTVRPQEWQGGERYGGTNNTWYAEYRAEIEGVEPGDEVEVWFSGVDVRPGSGRDTVQRVESEHFTYTLAQDTDAAVLIVANEDYEGFNPEQDVDEPQAVDEHVAALGANGISSDVWDVTAQGVPHDLGVLSHYDAVVWETGDNRLTQEAEDVLTSTPFGNLPDLQVAEEQQYLTISVRDYLNEGGKLLQSGEYVGYYGFFGGPLGGIYYGLNGDENGDCVITTSFFSDCLILSDDFSQYYQGVYRRDAFGSPDIVEGIDTPLEGLQTTVDGAQVPNSGAFTVTSDVLPVDDFPQFTSWASALYTADGPGPYEPFSGDRYAGAVHADESWMRLSQTVDLSGASSAELAFKLSYDLEPGYDNLIVEARPVGTTDWTTLPDLEGGTSQTVPSECEAGFYAALHPALERYLTIGNPCLPSGSTGEWHAFTGNSGGWTDALFDLSAYAGGEVEVIISYVTDPATGGVGAFVDDTQVTVDGVAQPVTDFESGPGPWSVLGSPESSPENAGNWQIAETLVEPSAAAVTTEDTVTFGYGFEAIATPEERATVMGEVMEYLLP